MNKYIKGFAFILLMMSFALIVMAVPPDIVITQPLNDNETVNGSFQFVAHITNPVENLNRVEFIITNTTGTVRSDYTNPNRNTSSSGEDFTYTLNTAELTDGSYTLIVNAINEDITSSNTTTVNRNFVINNIPQPNNPPMVPTLNEHLKYHNSESTNVSWGASTDSDGDSITYDVKVGTSSGGTDVVNQIGNGQNGSTSSTSSNTFTMMPTNTYYWSVRACDGYSCSTWSAESSFSFYNNAPVQAPIGNRNVALGNWLNFTVSATDADSDPITYGTNATKGTLNPTTGVYSWMPSGTDAGTYYWSFSSSDNYGGIASETIKVIVNDYTPNQPTNIQNNTYNFGVNWNWTKGANSDFTEVSVNGVFKENSTGNTYNFTEGKPHGTYTIQLREYNSTQRVYSDWTNQITTIPNNPPVQAPIGDKEVYKGQLLTFGISTTDADSDTITYGTNATKGSLNSNTGVFTWTPGDSDAGEYIWEFNSSDEYGEVDNEIIKVTVKNPLEIDLKFSEPYIINDNGIWTEAWRDAGVGHIGKFVGINHSFRNIGNDTLIITNITSIYTNKSKNPQELYPTTDNNPPLPLTLAENQSKSCPDMYSKCDFRFEIDSDEVKDGFYNFTMQINVTGYNSTNFIFNYTNITMVSLPIKPIFKIKWAINQYGQESNRGIIVPSATTPIIYSLEANSSVNLTNVSIYDPFYPEKYFNTSQLEANKPNGTKYTYPATVDSLSKFKCEGEEPCIINLATLTGKIESSGELFTDTEYVEICINKCNDDVVLNNKGSGGHNGGGGGSSGGGGGGGAPASSEDFNNIEAREVREMDVYAKSASTYVFKSTDPVMVVAFESSSSENAVPVAVEVLKNRSKFIGDDAPGKPYKYFNVFVGTSGFSKKVSKGVIAYRVNNSWLKENNIDPADISLYKWRGTWVKLDTQIAENRSNYTYYASLTGNFSSFAIAAAKDQKLGDAYASIHDFPSVPVEQQNTTQAMANFSGDEQKHKIPGLSAAAILVFGIAGIILYLKKNHKKFNRDVRK